MNRKEKIDFSDIPELTRNDFKRARRPTLEEIAANRQAIETKLGVRRPLRVGRPTKYPGGKLRSITIRLHPRVIAWAKNEAKRLGIGYQAVINEALMYRAA
jgi:uncharacterized protein (DUF4415 family)